MAGDLN